MAASPDKRRDPPVKAAPRRHAAGVPVAPKVDPRPAVLRADMRLTGWVVALTIAADQALKYWVVHGLRLDRLREIDVFPPWLNFRMAWNQGVNFGIGASDTDWMRWVLVGVAVVISLWVWFWVRRAAPGWLARLGAGLLIGGALGNVIDRLAYGAVADFLNMSLPFWQNPFSFNLADIAIFAGAAALVLMPSRPASDKPRDGAAKSR